MQEKINSFNAAFVDLAAGYVKHIANKMAGNTTHTPELSGGPLRWGESLADEVRVANLLAATIGKMQTASGGELPADGQHMTFRDGHVLGPGVTFRMENTSVSGPCNVPDGVEMTLEDLIKKIVREMMAAWQEVNAACCVNISREEAAEIERALREAGPGTIVPMEEATVTGPCVVIDMPDGERITLNSAAEAYKLAGCIEEMAGRVWPEVAKE